MEQATTTTLEAVAPTAEYTAMAQLAINIIKLMPIFDGNPGDLEERLTSAAQAGPYLEAINQSFPTAIRTSVYGILLRRFSPAVRAVCGIETTTDLACVTQKLKEKYGGFRCPAEWSAVKLLRMRWADGESPDDFAHRGRSPEPDRRNAERQVMAWLSDTLDDKAHQLVVRIVSGDSTLNLPEDRTESGLGA
ncbi:hypothetical protein AAG570_009035 [Ranatra chinensis]|uniref:Uncharacterized protein n=1 Tax=Ranatra chinensis TaxID=642074 RepID=A0ABD0ZFY8_9HEMI